MHCIPIDDSRWLHEQALKVVALDSIVNSQDRQIDILEAANASSATSYQKLLAIEQEKFSKQKEITSDMERLANSWRDEADYYRKRYKKQRKQKGLLTAATVGLIILFIVK